MPTSPQSMNWTRTLSILWTGQFLATMATSLGLAVIPFFLVEDRLLAVRDEGLRVFYTGLIFGGPFVTAIIATPLWGWLADRGGRKTQVVRAAFGLGLTQLLTGFARSPEQVVALRIIQGAIAGIVSANLGFLSASVTREQQSRAMVRLQSANPAGVVFGPLFGSLLATLLGYRPVYFINGSLVLGCALVMALLLREPTGEAPLADSPFRGIGKAIARIASAPELRTPFVLLLLAQLAISTTQVAYAIYAGRVIDAWVTSTGAARSWWNTGVGFTALGMVVSGATNFLSASYWGRARSHNPRHLTPSAGLVLAISNVALACWPPHWGVLLARVGIGAGMGGIGPLQYAAIGRNVSVAERGRYMGLATATTHIGSLIGFLGCGTLARSLGLSVNFSLAAGVYLLVATLAWLHAGDS